jgi:hypothetical protein
MRRVRILTGKNSELLYHKEPLPFDMSPLSHPHDYTKDWHNRIGLRDLIKYNPQVINGALKRKMVINTKNEHLMNEDVP